MGRLINPESAGKARTQLLRATVLAIRELMQQTRPDPQTRELAAFIALALESIAATIESSVAAWEKRDYWVKADRFRMDWRWAGQLGANMRQAVINEDWPGIARTAAQVAEKVGNVKVPQRHRLGTPWIGALDKLHEGGVLEIG